VRVGYEWPGETFAVNLGGTVNILDCVRGHGAQAIVVMTSDKVYGAGNGHTLHREDSALGAHDPYGASKACCELAVEAYARSFFVPSQIGVATIRAGNVLGGGDWQSDRLLPDAVRAFCAGRALTLRHPQAVRPWQHVLDAVRILLIVAQEAARQRVFIGPWNVGPPLGQAVTVAALADLVATAWGQGAPVVHSEKNEYPETHFLAIDGTRARIELGLRSPWDIATVVDRSVSWYKDALAGKDAWQLTMGQIDAYDTEAGRRAQESDS